MISQVFFMVLLANQCQLATSATIMYDKVYEITLYTGHESWAGTNAGVWIKIFGNAGHSEWKKLPDDKKYYEKGSIDKFDVTFDANYGQINKIQVGQDSDGMYADWKLEEVRVRHYNSLKTSRFIVRKWLKKQYGVSTRHIEATREEKVNCGRAPAQPRVVMGDTSAKSQWPWQAQIRKTSNEHHCGGTLIHPEWVLSASHCYFNDQSKDNYIITLGEHNRYQHERSEQTFRVKKMLIHPNYNPDKINNDLTLLQLDRPALITPDVQLACLPAPGYQLPPGEDCFVSGWGDEYVGSGTPVVLKHARLPSVSNKECYTNMKHINKVTDQMVCGGGNNRGGCFGDSGGPYVCLNQAGQFVVQGAVSWGVSDCKASEFFTVFARVGNFVSWIEENIYSKYISDF